MVCKLYSLPPHNNCSWHLYILLLTMTWRLLHRPLGNGIRVPRHGNFHMPLLGRVYNDPFDLYFFDALANVTQLTVIGLATANNLQLPLLSHQLRKLKELELKCCYIQDNFMEFLIAHLLTLRV